MNIEKTQNVPQHEIDGLMRTLKELGIKGIMENRITIDDLKERYNVSERTLRTWKETKGLPLREITPQNKWVYENELKNWENSFL